jgi:hypothetical protein
MIIIIPTMAITEYESYEPQFRKFFMTAAWAWFFKFLQYEKEEAMYVILQNLYLGAIWKCIL